MTRNEVITKAKEALETSRLVMYDQSFYQECMNEYATYIWALKSIDDPYPWEQAIEAESRRADIESRLPNVSEEEFDEYTHIWNQLGILYHENA